MNPYLLVPIHIIFGVAATFLPIWSYLESLKPNESVSRPLLKRISIYSFSTLIISCFSAGYYYINIYGPQIRPAIIDTKPWVHYFIMESKEHIFLFMIPLYLFLIILSFSPPTDTSRLFIRRVSFFILLCGLYAIFTGFFITAAREFNQINIT